MFAVLAARSLIFAGSSEIGADGEAEDDGVAGACLAGSRMSRM